MSAAKADAVPPTTVRNQGLPEVQVDDWIDVQASNRAQQRGPHGAFRFFGKLAPDVTAAVLDRAASLLPELRTPVVDVMCGSGTTLIEAAARGWSSVGLDCNPVALLYAECKTQSVDREAVKSALENILSTVREPTPAEVDERFANTRNAERWFSESVRTAYTALAAAVERLPASRERRLLFAVLISRARRISMASERTGRIFYDRDAAAHVPIEDFSSAVARVLDAVPTYDLPVALHRGDAREAPVESNSSQLVFCHPPYFGLYRFSADVLRFELELGGFDRRETNRHEIREGWKSGDVSNLDHYVADMKAVFREGRRIAVEGGILALVASNSTLGDLQLPVIDELASAASAVGWDLERHSVRRARHGSASYHRSARPDKVINQDHVLFFRAT